MNKFVFLLLAASLLLVGNVFALDQDMARFADEKANQVRELAKGLTNKVPALVWSFFDAVRVDDWETATNLAERLAKASGRFHTSETNQMSLALRTWIWPPISETWGTYAEFHDWNSKWLHRFGRGIIDSIPKGSIYFGGTDPGRFVVSALCESQRDGLPFFTLTQNQLADHTYLEYLQSIYGRKIHVLTTNDFTRAFNDYCMDATNRMRTGNLKSGESVKMVDGKGQVSGSVSIMAINGLMVKMILEKNPDREFYVEESFPLDWMYPQLTPHGLIMRLHTAPLSELPETEIEADQAYWKKAVGEMIGDWISEKTSMKELCDFADKTYVQKDLDGFKGDIGFAKNDAAQKTFSKLRTSIAGIYVWRMGHAKSMNERVQMQKAAELAFQQAFALCPYSPEASYRYCYFLREIHRLDEAISMMQESLRSTPKDSEYYPQLQDLIRRLHQLQ